jgi:hypothetical protein
MRFATPTAAFYCGIDLHARTMYLVVLDQSGAIRLNRNYPARPDAFLAAVAPFRPDPFVRLRTLISFLYLLAQMPSRACVRQTAPIGSRLVPSALRIHRRPRP